MTTKPLTDEAWYGKPEDSEDWPEAKTPNFPGEVIGGDPVAYDYTEVQESALAVERALPAEVRLREQEVRLNAREARRGERFRMTMDNVDTRSKLGVFMDDHEWLLLTILPVLCISM